MFYRLSWSGQLFAAIVLFTVSFFMEAIILHRYLASAWIAYPLAAALEISKVLTIVLYRIYHDRSRGAMAGHVALLTHLFRLGLIMLSVLATVMYLSAHLDRPLREEVRTADLAAAQELAQQRAQTIREGARLRYDEALQSLRQRYAEERQRRQREYRATIADLEQALRAEMDNTVNGQFKGPRYAELERRLSAEKAHYDEALQQLLDKESAEEQATILRLEQIAAHEWSSHREETDNRIAAIRTASYIGDERVENSSLVAFITLLREITGVELTVLGLTALFAVFISLLTELGIFVTFEYIASTRGVIFEEEARADVAIKRKKIELETELELHQMDDDAVRRKSANVLDSILARAEDLMPETAFGRSRV